MTTPQFKTRAELEAWRGKKRHIQSLRFARGRDRSARHIGNLVGRVTAAHAHLMKDTDHDAD